MTSRERVKRTIEFKKPDRIARDLWTLPIASEKYEKEINKIFEKYPIDFGHPEYSFPSEKFTKGDPYAIGEYIDAWGCKFKNIQKGVVGEVKEPLIKELNQIRDFSPPYAVLDTLKTKIDEINKSCQESELFMVESIGGIFERLQFLRGSENLFIDIASQPKELFKLIELVHDYNLKHIEILGKTILDGISFFDDWGAQNSLLISPAIWRKIFKPLYRDYCRKIHEYNKYVLMHSDGYIIDIIGDLIEIGVDVLNSQLFCMNIEEIGRKFKGKITFWGEIDRQHVLVSEDLELVRKAVRRLKDNLWDRDGGVIAQCEFGAAARPENVEAVFEEWEKLTS